MRQERKSKWLDCQISSLSSDQKGIKLKLFKSLNVEKLCWKLKRFALSVGRLARFEQPLVLQGSCPRHPMWGLTAILSKSLTSMVQDFPTHQALKDRTTNQSDNSWWNQNNFTRKRCKRHPQLNDDALCKFWSRQGSQLRPSRKNSVHDCRENHWDGKIRQLIFERKISARWKCRVCVWFEKTQLSQNSGRAKRFSKKADSLSNFQLPLRGWNQTSKSKQSSFIVTSSSPASFAKYSYLFYNERFLDAFASGLDPHSSSHVRSEGQ